MNEILATLLSALERDILNIIQQINEVQLFLDIKNVKMEYLKAGELSATGLYQTNVIAIY